MLVICAANNVLRQSIQWSSARVFTEPNSVMGLQHNNWQEFEGQKGYGYQIKSTVKNPRPEDMVFQDVTKFDRLADI